MAIMFITLLLKSDSLMKIFPCIAPLNKRISVFVYVYAKNAVLGRK